MTTITRSELAINPVVREWLGYWVAAKFVTGITGALTAPIVPASQSNESDLFKAVEGVRGEELGASRGTEDVLGPVDRVDTVD